MAGRTCASAPKTFSSSPPMRSTCCNVPGKTHAARLIFAVHLKRSRTDASPEPPRPSSRDLVTHICDNGRAWCWRLARNGPSKDYRDSFQGNPKDAVGAAVLRLCRAPQLSTVGTPKWCSPHGLPPSVRHAKVGEMRNLKKERQKKVCPLGSRSRPSYLARLRP